MKYKAMIGAILIAAAGWFGWWFYAASAQKTAIETWLADRRSAGWVAEVADIAVAGFPNRLDANVSALSLADPASGWAWDAPTFTIRQLAYDPTRAIVEWPPLQTVAGPGEKAEIATETMRASATFAASSALRIERNSLEIRNMAITADTGWTTKIATYQHHLRTAEAGADDAYEFRVVATEVGLPPFLDRIVDPGAKLPDAIATLVIEGKAALDRPLDRFAFEGPKPQIAALSLKEARAVWGELELELDGAIKADGRGYAEGELDLSATKWREMLKAAEAAGAIDGRLADTIAAGLGLIARLSGDSDTVQVPLTFSSGYTRLGPIPIGPAPRLLN